MELLEPDASRFSIGEASFVIDTSGGRNRRPSDDEAFTIVKTPEFLNRYIDLSSSLRPRSILELGIFQGGGFVFFDSLFSPDKIAAVEIGRTPVAPLMDWIKKRPGRFAHFGSNQTDSKLLKRIVSDELGGTLDLVIDDASHRYEATRLSFETLFPLLAPGGYYVIEDWSWAHAPLYQGDQAPRAGSPALTNLVFDLILLHGSTPFIEAINIYKTMVVVHRATSTVVPKHFWTRIRNRGKEAVLV
jgi:Cephalosporin hydroxylase